MHVLSKRPFNDAKKLYPNDADAIQHTYDTLKRGNYKTPLELKAIFATLDNFKPKEKWYVIDIGGNNLRLIAFIEFRHNRIYVKHIVTHAEYDKICARHSKT